MAANYELLSDSEQSTEGTLALDGIAAALLDQGHVAEVVLGSSPVGEADANAQYYYCTD